jgi:hypothetical protein
MSKYYSTGAFKNMQVFKKLQLNFVADMTAFRQCQKNCPAGIRVKTGEKSRCRDIPYDIGVSKIISSGFPDVGHVCSKPAPHHFPVVMPP